jgi:hypothetical protein
MVEVAEITEDCTLLGEAFQKIVSDGGLIVLIFEDDDEHVVEMLWRRCGTGSSGCVLCKAENRDGPKKSAFLAKVRPCQHQSGMYPPSSKSLAVLRLRRRSPLKGCTLFASWTSSLRQNTWSEESSVTSVAAFSCDLAHPERYTDNLGHSTVLARFLSVEVSGFCPRGR